VAPAERLCESEVSIAATHLPDSSGTEASPCPLCLSPPARQPCMGVDVVLTRGLTAHMVES
jgi:hypothetical protein